MPRVREQTKSSRGKRTCGVCGKDIKPGERYFTWSFRYGGRQVRCLEHPPKQSDLTQSKMATIYAAIEEFNTTFANGADNPEEIKEAVHGLADTVREVAEEYRAAAEPFGGQGQNAERADELDGFADELESFEPEWEEAEFSEEEHDEEAKERSLDEGCSYHDALQMVRDEWEDAQDEERNQAIDNALEEARNIFDQCPF